MSLPPKSETQRQSLRDFAATMPVSYRERYAPAQMAAHAHVSATRGERPVHLATFPWHDPSLTALCVVADDRPGLLALISEAFLECEIDVQAAEAYTRRIADGSLYRSSGGPSSGLAPSEAVDLFWLRRVRGGILSDNEMEAVRAHLLALLSGERASAERLDNVDLSDFVTETTVRFIADEGGQLNVLEVETDDRSGLLFVLSRALYELQVQITSSQVRTTDKRVFDRFTLLELDGTPIEESRRLEIQVAVLSAIEPMTQIREIRRA